MQTKLSILLLMLFIFSSCYTTNFLNNENIAINEIYNNYKNCIIGNEIENAVKYVSIETFKYYDEIIELALYGTKDEIVKLPLLFDRLYVLIVRYYFSVDTLIKLKGKEFFIEGMKENLINKDIILNMSIKNIVITKKSAIADIILDDEITDLKLKFIKEKNNWKIDIVSFHKEFNFYFQDLLNEFNGTETEFLLEFIRTISHEDLDATQLYIPLIIK